MVLVFVCWFFFVCFSFFLGLVFVVGKIMGMVRSRFEIHGMAASGTYKWISVYRLVPQLLCPSCHVVRLADFVAPSMHLSHGHAFNEHLAYQGIVISCLG